MTGAGDTLRWRELDARHHIHPFTDHLQLAAKGSRIITRAEGCWLWDSEGNRILDGMAGLWCVNVGYGRPELVEAARRQMAMLPYYNTFFQSSTPAAVDLAARLAQLRLGGQRHRDQAGALLLESAAAADQEDHDQPGIRLPRHDPGHRQHVRTVGDA